MSQNGLYLVSIWSRFGLDVPKVARRTHSRFDLLETPMRSRVHEFGKAISVALARHDDILQNATQSRGGRVFNTVGDAFCVAFSDASDAVEAALASQRSLSAEGWEEGFAIRAQTSPLIARRMRTASLAETSKPESVRRPRTRRRSIEDPAWTPDGAESLFALVTPARFRILGRLFDPSPKFTGGRGSEFQ
jgi:class 3 adenylate cyclase